MWAARRTDRSICFLLFCQLHVILLKFINISALAFHPSNLLSFKSYMEIHIKNHKTVSLYSAKDVQQKSLRRPRILHLSLFFFFFLKSVIYNPSNFHVDNEENILHHLQQLSGTGGFEN